MLVLLGSSRLIAWSYMFRATATDIKNFFSKGYRFTVVNFFVRPCFYRKQVIVSDVGLVL